MAAVLDVVERHRVRGICSSVGARKSYTGYCAARRAVRLELK